MSGRTGGILPFREGVTGPKFGGLQCGCVAMLDTSTLCPPSTRASRSPRVDASCRNSDAQASAPPETLRRRKVPQCVPATDPLFLGGYYALWKSGGFRIPPRSQRRSWSWSWCWAASMAHACVPDVLHTAQPGPGCVRCRVQDALGTVALSAGG